MKQKEPDLEAGTPLGPHSISELSEDGQGYAGPAVTEMHHSKVSKLGLRNGSLLQGGYCRC